MPGFTGITLIVIEVLASHTPTLLKKLLTLPLRNRVRRWIAKRLQIDKVFIDRADLPPADGTLPSPFKHITIRVDIDNRSPEDLDIDGILVRTRVNGSWFKDIVWQGRNDVPEYHSEREPELSIYPSWARMAKNSKSVLRLSLFLPPYIPHEKEIYVSLSGVLRLQSAFGIFPLSISQD